LQAIPLSVDDSYGKPSRFDTHCVSQHECMPPWCHMQVSNLQWPMVIKPTITAFAITLAIGALLGVEALLPLGSPVTQVTRRFNPARGIAIDQMAM